MISGIALAAKSLRPSVLVVAAEPSGSNGAADVAASKARGTLVGGRAAQARDFREGSARDWCRCHRAFCPARDNAARGRHQGPKE
jgi:hypothetical protein